MEDKSLARSSRTAWVAGGALTLVALVGAALIALRWGGEETASLPAERVATAPAPAPSAPPVAADAAAADELLRTWARKLTPSPLLLRWLEGSDLARQFVAAVQLVADGESPRRMLAFLKPEGSFQVVERDGQRFVAGAAWARYDPIAEAIASIDVDQAAAAWKVVGPPLSALYREIAPPDRTLEGTLAKALSALTSTPDLPAEVEVVEKGALFAYADPELEGLSAAQKHLLRMGPSNQQTVKAKLRELQTALGLTVAAK